MFTLATDSRSAKTPRRARKRLRPAAAAAVVAIALLASATPAWAVTNTVAIGPVASLTAKVAISVPVTIVCDPLTDPGISSTVSVSVKQANGKQISTAYGAVVGGSSGGTVLTCDGSTQNNVVVKAVADPGSGPFKGGTAYVTANFSYQGGQSCGVNCSFPTGSESGSGSAVVKLH